MYQINTFTEPTVKKKKKFSSHSFKGHNQNKIIAALSTLPSLSSSADCAVHLKQESPSQLSGPKNSEEQIHSDGQCDTWLSILSLMSAWRWIHGSVLPLLLTKPLSQAREIGIRAFWDTPALHTLGKHKKVIHTPQGGLDLHQQNKNPVLHERTHFAF